MFARAGNGGDDGVAISFPGRLNTGKRRNINALSDESQSSFGQQRRCTSVEDFDGVTEAVSATDAVSARPPEEKEIPHADGGVQPASKALAIVDKAGNNDVGSLLEALLDRDREKQKARAEEAKAKRLATAAEKAAAKLTAITEKGEDDDVVVVSTPSKKLKSKGAESGKTSKKLSPGSCIKKRAGRVDHEASRQQYLARSLMHGSRCFKYGKDYPYKKQSAALEAAKKWLANPA